MSEPCFWLVEISWASWFWIKLAAMVSCCRNPNLWLVTSGWIIATRDFFKWGIAQIASSNAYNKHFAEDQLHFSNFQVAWRPVWAKILSASVAPRSTDVPAANKRREVKQHKMQVSRALTMLNQSQQSIYSMFKHRKWYEWDDGWWWFWMRNICLNGLTSPNSR